MEKEFPKQLKYSKLPKEYPILDYLSITLPKELDFVYRPSEDTFLFLDALYLEQKSIAKQKPTFVMEIGCGTGLLINSL